MRLLPPGKFLAKAKKAIDSGAVKTGRVISWPVSGTCADPARVSYQCARSVTEGVIDLYAPCGHCDSCLRYRGWQFAKRAAVEHARCGKTWFTTLTFAPYMRGKFLASMAGVEDSNARRLRLVQTSGRELTLYLKRMRKAGIEVRYIACPELHKDGMPHWHCLLHTQAKYREVREHWFAGISEMKLLEDSGGILYATKYLAKAKLGRVRCSKHYGQPLTGTPFGLGSEGEREIPSTQYTSVLLSTGLSGAIPTPDQVATT